LKAMTLKPWSAAFMIRFWPMTARPIRPKSPLGSERAGEPTLMPASRALKSASKFCQSSVFMDVFRGSGGGQGGQLASGSLRPEKLMSKIPRYCG
jgi:hypothetical protein